MAPEAKGNGHVGSGLVIQVGGGQNGNSGVREVVGARLGLERPHERREPGGFLAGGAYGFSSLLPCYPDRKTEP